MSKTDTIFAVVAAYSLLAAYIWMFVFKEHFGAFCAVIIVGLPVPFIVDHLWERF